ncbi:hypothetical protein KIN20_005585 [Parelaphostrongylus tenuis]|uniref:Cytoplasmic tRNA 2-thiolation protein 2 n=1 Tax=Parelaphostrongylus tenuis TaxID=148309 RepID=A0AAD5M4S4_PARTN|nr:hypothetical protein KIN20_005585 [Parelaphostrongylus tenuis]
MGLLWLDNLTEDDDFITNNTILGCVKCPKDEALYFERNEKSLFCEDCFLRLLKWNFKCAISKRRIFRVILSQKVVVVLDGSKESAFLFRQIEEIVKDKTCKRIVMEPSFVLMLCSMDAAEIGVLEKKLCILRQALSSTYYIIHLASVFGELRMYDDGRCQGLEHVPKLIEFSKSFRTASSREEMVRILRIRLLEDISRCLGISKVMTSCNSDVLARLMVNQLCLGRGARVATMTDVVEKSSRGTTFIRPLRDISSQEIVAALRLEKAEHYVLSSYSEDSALTGF